MEDVVALIRAQAEPAKKRDLLSLVRLRRFNVRHAGALAAVALLMGCDDTPRTYSSCVIRSLASARNNYIATLISQACEDKFRSTSVIRPTGTATIATSPTTTKVNFRLKNNDQDYMILRTEIRMSELDAPDGKEVNTYTWSFNEHIGPGAEVILVGDLSAVPKGWKWSVGRVEGVNVR